MTREEKINADIASKSRDEKLVEIRDKIADWDLCSLIEYVQDNVTRELDVLSDSDLGDEYYEWSSEQYEYSDFDDDDDSGSSEPQAVVNQEEVCGQCGKLKDSGVSCWWCGSK